VGVVGTGFAASAHLDALRRIPEVEVVAVAGSDATHTAALAARHGIAAYADHRRLLDEASIDAVHTCTVNALHHDVSLDALTAGKHVLSEKPLAASGDESASLVCAAERAAADGVLSGVCFNYRHYPMVAQLRELVRSGEYGPVHFVHGHYLQDWLLLDSDWNWRVADADESEGGSRAMADIGSHWIDLAEHLTGQAITEVLADVATLHGTRLRPAAQTTTFGTATVEGARRVAVDSEDYGTALLRFANGARGTFTVSQASAGSKNGLRIQLDGAEGALSWEQERPERAWIGRRSAPNLELVRDPAALHPRAARLARLPAGHPEGWFDALRNVFVDFYGAVACQRSGEPYESDVASFRDGHARVTLVEAIMRSAREGRWVEVQAAGMARPGAANSIGSSRG
jgi:predicted dehydrogenase